MKSKKPDHSHVKKLSGLAVVFSLIALASSALILIQYRNLRNNYAQLKSDYLETIWQPGEKALSPRFGITVTGLSKDTTGIPQYLPAPDGMQFVTVSLVVENLTDQTQLFLPQDHLYIEDDYGTRYDLSVAPTLQTPIAGDIEIGIAKSGEAGYTVPINTNELYLVFESYGLEPSIPVKIDLSEYL